jgi:hypothetical protein
VVRRPTAIFACVGLVLIGVIAFAVGSVGAKTSGPPTLAFNKAAAKTDAAKLQAEVILPSDAKKLSAEPAGDHGYLKPEPHLSANPGFVDTSWWRVTGSTPDQVISAIQASPPSGVASTGTDGGGNTKTGTSSTGLTFSLKDVPRILESRMIEVTATALSSDSTGVMVQTQSQWVVPRTAASLIPSTAHMISVNETTAAGKVLRSTTVTAPSRVRVAITYFNGLESSQPGTTNCPAETGGSDVVVVDFLSSPGKAPLATATCSSDFGQRYAGLSSECDEVRLRVGTNDQVGLLGGNYIATLNRLLGAHIPN